MSPTARHRAVNIIQSILIIGAMVAIGWVILIAIVGPQLTLSILIGSVLGLLLAPTMSRRVLLSAYNARPLSPEEFPQGHAILTELAQRARLPRVPELYYVPSELPNAFAIGSPESSVICVTDGLLRILNKRELAGVLAHEVSHIANRDLWIMGVADAMSRAVSMASWIGQTILLINLPLLMIGAAYVPWQVPLILVFSPTIMALMQLALSRTREYDADRGAAELTGDPEGLISALEKLEQTFGKFWEEIFLPARRIPDPSLLRTHPPTQERIRRLREIAVTRGQSAFAPEVLKRPKGPPVPPPHFGKLGLYR